MKDVDLYKRYGSLGILVSLRPNKNHFGLAVDMFVKRGVMSLDICNKGVTGDGRRYLVKTRYKKEYIIIPRA